MMQRVQDDALALRARWRGRSPGSGGRRSLRARSSSPASSRSSSTRSSCAIALDRPIPWADEVSVILFIWVIFWANAFILREREQITFDLVYRLLPPRGQRAAALLRTLVVGGLFAAALPTVVDYIAFLWREHTAVLMIRLDYVYACFGLFVFMVAVRACIELARLAGRRWREHL